MKDFKKLIVWEKGMTLVEKVYLITSKYPTTQQHGLISQTQRSAVSIVSNIAEGAGRGGDREFVHFLNIAYGSTCELETQLLLAQRLLFVSQQETESAFILLDEIQKMISVLKNKIQSTDKSRVAESTFEYKSLNN